MVRLLLSLQETALTVWLGVGLLATKQVPKVILHWQQRDFYFMILHHYLHWSNPVYITVANVCIVCYLFAIVIFSVSTLTFC